MSVDVDGCGGQMLDVGCGPLGVLDLLSAAVGPYGDVIGLDNEPGMIAHARQTITELSLANVRLVLGEAAQTGLAADSLDLAHERLVLINHGAPQDVVAEMVRVVRPGGWIVLQEADMLSWTCEPQHPAWDELLAAFIDAFTAAGLNPFIGRRLPALLRQAGLTSIEFDAHAHLWRPGHPYQTLLLQFIATIRERILARPLLTEDRLDHLTADLARHLARPGTFVIHPLLFQAWAPVDD